MVNLLADIGVSEVRYSQGFGAAAKSTYNLHRFLPRQQREHSADNHHFATTYTNEALTALARGTSGGDGVYTYSSNAAPPDQQL